jgi:uncharacterized protein YdhG (YjbR/CyaY superfamily)
MTSETTPTTIDDYIAEFPSAIAKRLTAMRRTIRKHAPDATERISYRIPTFYMGGNLVHFAGFANHVGFYPGPTGIEAFRDELARFKGAKGSVQFPHDEPLPLDLVAEIVKFRVEENTAKARAPKARAPKAPAPRRKQSR